MDPHYGILEFTIVNQLEKVLNSITFEPFAHKKDNSIFPLKMMKINLIHEKNLIY